MLGYCLPGHRGNEFRWVCLHDGRHGFSLSPSEQRLWLAVLGEHRSCTDPVWKDDEVEGEFSCASSLNRTLAISRSYLVLLGLEDAVVVRAVASGT